MNRTQVCNILKKTKSDESLTVIFPEKSEYQAIYFAGLHLLKKIVCQGLDSSPTPQDIERWVNCQDRCFEFRTTDKFDKNLIVPLSHLIEYIG